MKVVLYSPWDNAWVPLYRQEFEKRGHEFVFSKNGTIHGADVYLHGWADTSHAMEPGAKNIMFMRRYELYEMPWAQRTDWKNLSHIVCVNEMVADFVRGTLEELKQDIPVSVIYNAVDAKDWTFKKRKPNTNVGMACHIHPKKNLPLAMNIMAELPENYALHIAGGNQDQWLLDYMNNLASCTRRKLYIYGQLPYDQMDLWWEQMGVCLSTSYSEGNPNNVIQAMAKGIKPIVHLWPGAIEQFPAEYLFATASEAAQMIQDKAYDSEEYRRIAVENFGLANIAKVADMVGA